MFVYDVCLKGVDVMDAKFIIKSLVVAAGVFIGHEVFAASVTAKVDEVPVFKEASTQSQVMQKMKKGDKLSSKERKGMFWEVTLPGGGVGYVPFLKVQRNEDGDDSSLAKAIRNAAQSDRTTADTSARARSAVMGVRGLDEGEEIATASSARPNLRLVYRMEDRQIDDTRVSMLGDEIMKEIELKAQKKGQ